MSLSCPQGVLYVPQEVQDCHLLVHVTSEVSDTPSDAPLSQPLSVVMQSPRPMTRQYTLLRLPLYLWWCLYSIYAPITVTIALYECPFIFEASL